MKTDTRAATPALDEAELELDALIEAGEPLAAGYLEFQDASPLRRAARGLRRHFEHSPLPEWGGEPLYPCGAVALPAGDSAAFFSYWSSVNIDPQRLQRKAAQAGDEATFQALQQVGRRMAALYRVGSVVPPGRNLGGGGYTHSIINFGRVLREGLLGYGERLERYAAAATDAGRLDFYAAMRDVLDGLTALHQRSRDRIEQAIAARPDLIPAGIPLLNALDQAPLHPARTLYEAFVAVNWLWYADGSDDLGRLDQDLAPWLDAVAGDEAGRRRALDLITLLWRNVDAVPGWNVALGGSAADGRPAYNAITELCLEAAAGRRRPNLALRVRRDMPDAIWQRAIDAIASGCGLPALYNEEGYRSALPAIFAGVEGDLHRFAFGGCTETMFHGCSNVGSIDGGLNLLAVFERTLRQRLAGAPAFDVFLDQALDDIRAAIRDVIDCVNTDQRLKAEHQPQPLRSLLIDDCLERGVEFNAGGARYNSGVINIAGIANVADSLCAVRDLVFSGRVSPARLAAALDADFTSAAPDAAEVWAMIRACPRFGNDDDRVDGLAAAVAEAAFGEVRRHRTWRGNTPFQPGCIMFVTYADAGQAVPATPDGRRNGEPVADSIGPMQGRDRHGPTSMLRSVCKLPLSQATGTPVLNIRFSRDLFKTAQGRAQFQALVRAYFDLGGMQIQASVVDQEALRDAIAHPERHGDLIVRIGGYSEYFNNLSPSLKLSVLERTEHG